MRLRILGVVAVAVSRLLWELGQTAADFSVSMESVANLTIPQTAINEDDGVFTRTRLDTMRQHEFFTQGVMDYRAMNKR